LRASSAVLLVVGFLVRGSRIIEVSVADGPVMLVYALVSIAIGVAMVLGHNVWSGGALPVVVTLVGRLALAKGLLLLFLTPETVSGMFGQMRYAEHYSLFLVPAPVLGLYLTWAGFTTTARAEP
jgi:hypothetical protein